ncbi:uncharacterized protein [Musca autumnalis]|uniref:uncharacterized protein n=1 Tax=Musca autumnalis TaxID=221902 RepID=UPI003CEF7DD5
MAKFMQILFVAFLALALVAAQPKRFQGRRNRFLARQEVAAEAVTPYPSADELKPEVPFDEGMAVEEETPVVAEEETPVVVEEETPVITEEETPVVAEEETPFTPDEVYGPPEEEEFPVVTEDVAEEESVPTEEEIASARLTARRAGARKVAARPAKLRKPVRASPAKLRKAAPARRQ